MSRIYLSAPDVGELEREYLMRAFDSNWIAPVGPDLNAFEHEIASTTGREHAVALASGTAALHLALLALRVPAGSDVLLPTLTFVAAANAVCYLGANPVFVDSEAASWNMDPALLEDELSRRAQSGNLPAAVIVVDLYGQCADYDKIVPLCEKYGVPVLEDAAEALGANHRERKAGSFGVAAVISFNGNKIITTSGGGMLVTDDPAIAKRARHLATQAREPVLHYEHTEVGFNYRMSNLLAALGRAQLQGLGERIDRRATIHERYRRSLEAVDGLRFLSQDLWGRSNYWLTCLLVECEGTTRDDIINALEGADIEARPTWKPMHRQPLYEDAPAVISGVADRVFDSGLCLPTGSGMIDAEQDRVIDVILETLDR